jgi:hypothetical protein
MPPNNENYGGRIGTDEIELQLEATRAFLSALAHRCEALAAQCPRNCFVGTRIDPRVEAIWALRVAGRTRGWDGLGDKLPDVAHLRAWVEAPGGKASKERSTLTTQLEERVALLERWRLASVAEGDELAEAKRQLERGHPRAARTLQDRASAERFSHPLWKTLEERESAFLNSIEQVRQAPNSKKALMLARLVRAEAEWAKVESDSEYGRELELLEKKFLRSRRTKLIGLAAGITALLIAAPLVKSAYESASERAVAKEKLRVERVVADEKLRVEETRRTNISNLEKQQAELIEEMRSTSDLKVRLSSFFAERELLLADERWLKAAAQARAIVVLRKLNQIILRNQLPIPKFKEENPLEVMEWRKETRLHDYHLGRIELRVEKGTFSRETWGDEISFSALPKELTGAVGPDIVRDLKEHLADELRLKEITKNLRSISSDMKPVFQVWSNEKNIQNKDLDKTLEDHEILVKKLADVAKALAELRAEAAAP